MQTQTNWLPPYGRALRTVEVPIWWRVNKGNSDVETASSDTLSSEKLQCPQTQVTGHTYILLLLPWERGGVWGIYTQQKYLLIVFKF